MAGRLVNQGELSEILDISKVTITNWCRDYGMPIAIQGKRGQANMYDLGEVFRWYGNWQVDKVLSKGAERGGKIVDLKKEEARLKMHQADKAEVEAMRARGEVLVIDHIKQELMQIAVTFGSQLDALGGRLANDLAAITDPGEIRQLLFEEGRRIRNDTADALEELTMAVVERDSEPSEGTDAPDLGFMG